MAISPVLTISTSPWGLTMRSKASILSAEPVTSIVIVRRATSTILARKISANWMISARFSTAEETLNSAISRATVSSGSMSRIFRTLTSLCSCLVTWSIGWTAPSTVRVIRETSGSSVGPTASVSMLKPRRLNRPAIRARTPGRFSTRIERTCLRPVSSPAAASRSSSLIRSGVPASISAHHVPGGCAGRDHRVAVLFLGDANVEEDRALGGERLAHRPLDLVLVVDHHSPAAEGLGQLRPAGAWAHLHRGVAPVPEELLPLTDHAEVAVVHQEDLDRDLVADGGGELLAGHDQAAVTCEAHNRVLRLGDLGADRRREAEAHGAEPARVDPAARLGEVVVLRAPHLVLADVGGDDRVATGRRVHRLDHPLRLDLVVLGVLVAERVLLLPGMDLLPPGVEPTAVGLDRAVLLGQLGQDLLGVSDDRDVRRDVLRDLGRIDVDVDELGARGELGELARDPIVEAGADVDDQIGIVHRVVGGPRAVHPEHAEPLLMAGGEAAQSHQRAGDGEVVGGAELAQLLGGVAVDHAAARVDYGPLGVGESLGG